MAGLIPWLRSIVAFPLGVVSIQLFHLLGRQIAPQAYGQLESDTERAILLALATVAGIIGSFVVGAVARHRIWLHMAVFLALMLFIDLSAIQGKLAAQPIWFKTLLLATLPLQASIGGKLALLTIRKRVAAAI